MSTFYNHPCIIMWVPYNEGWGQWDTERITKLIKELDPTRLVNPASGWSDRGVGDVHDIHSYPGPAAPANEENRAAVLGEFGGLGLPVKGHTWQAEKNWGYRSFKTHEALTEAYVSLLGRLRPLIAKGLAAAVYTQTSDVEIEVNGMMTYDRDMIKFDAEKAAAAAKRLYLPPPIVGEAGLRRFGLEERTGRLRHEEHARSGRADRVERLGYLDTPGLRAQGEARPDTAFDPPR